jgi:membrane associated rhomboid family serine protease
MVPWESRLLRRKGLVAMKSSGERRETTLTIAEEVDRLRLRYGFWIIIAGFVPVTFITIVSTFRWTEFTSVATVVGVVASLVGTVVGVFFGVQVGAVGKERRRRPRASAQKRWLDGSGCIVHVTARVCSTAKI